MVLYIAGGFLAKFLSHHLPVDFVPSYKDSKHFRVHIFHVWSRMKRLNHTTRVVSIFFFAQLQAVETLKFGSPHKWFWRFHSICCSQFFVETKKCNISSQTAPWIAMSRLKSKHIIDATASHSQHRRKDMSKQVKMTKFRKFNIIPFFNSYNNENGTKIARKRNRKHIVHHIKYYSKPRMLREKKGRSQNRMIQGGPC